MGEIAATLAAMVVVIGAVAGGVVAIRRWIAGVARSAQAAEVAAAKAAKETARQLATSNGHTIGQCVEQTAQELAALRSEVHILTQWTGDNRTLAQQASVDAATAASLAQRAHDRLDAVLVTLAGDKAAGG